GFLIPFSAAKCPPLSGPSLLANICLRCWKGHDGSGYSAFTAAKGTLSEATAPLMLQGLFAALRRRRCARSQAQGCDRQFG
ncbi:hypothetical protein VH86_24370, partial [Pantoea sp. BL1]